MASLVSLDRAVRAAGAPRCLLFAGINWAKLQGVSRPSIGAPSPTVARESYTRQARREQRQRQIARRSGQDRFLASLRQA